MNSAVGPSSEANGEYVFRFDTELAPVIFGGEAKLSGWLIHRDGQPIHGLRAIVRRAFLREQIFPARRKRHRPDLAAAFPEMPDAETSGFLFELQLPFGRSRVVFQVRDHERNWRSFASAKVTAYPFTSLTRVRLGHTRDALISILQRTFPSNPARTAADSSLGDTAASSSPTSLPSRVDLFATSKSNLFIVEIGELVAAGFRELGCPAQLQLDAVPSERPPEGVLQIVVTPHEFYNLFLTEKVSRTRAQELTREVYLLCTEQPETGWFESNLQWGAHSLGMADINPLGVAAYCARGLPAQHLPLGYHPILAHGENRPHAQRSYDLAFLGSMTERRDRFFAQHADFFAGHRCHLRLVPLGFAKTKETRSYLSVARRNALLNDSRILLNLHYSTQKYFEWHRMLVGLANGCCIITETCHGYAPLVPGKHFIMVEPEDLVASCQYYLAHPDECERIARAGQEFIQAELRQAQTCEAFLRSLQAQPGGQPAAFSPELPLDPPSVPLPVALRKEISRQARRSFGEAFRRDLQNWKQPAKPAIEASATITPAAPDPAQRPAVIAKRDAYKSRLHQQEETAARGEPIFELHDNDAVTTALPPKLSVVITLYNYEQHIDACLESVVEAAARFREPIEVVIVNDASTDHSLACALRAQRLSPLPMRVADKRFNTGLADARNTGTRLARAPFVFMMDADNLVFPEALKQLFETISETDYAAVYSILCRFRGRPDNRVGLLSYFDWDPQILVQYPYIDAMALFRRDVLLELGGYDNHLSQIGWFGWEDYDMWLKFVQRDYQVAFVPNTLCLYRHHDTSMISTTNLFEADLVQYFIAHYGDLLARFEPREKVFGVKRDKIAGNAGSADLS